MGQASFFSVFFQNPAQQEVQQTTQKSLCKSRAYKTPRLASVLFQQLHVGHRHAPVNGFAHVVDR
jgi:hypothetical protein